MGNAQLANQQKNITAYLSLNCGFANCFIYLSLVALLCVGKEVPRNPPALHAGPLRFLPRRKKLGKKGFAIWSLRGVRITFPY